MNLFSWLRNVLSTSEPKPISSADGLHDTKSYQDDFTINPANGLPMVGGMPGLDIEGNPFGTNLHDSFEHSSLFDLNDSFSSNSWDDSF